MDSDACARCHRLDGLKRCSRCRGVQYCSKECQRSDWKTHKAVCSRPPADRVARQPDAAPDKSRQADSKVEGSVGHAPAQTETRQITSLYMSKIDLSLRDGKWLQYFSDTLGLSELDLSRYIGNEDGKLVWGSTDFHLTTTKAQLCNGHVLIARMYRADGITLTESWINLDTYIHCDDEVLVYDPERVNLGQLIWPWTMREYHI